jgi:DNA-binding NarL/FixJ family response regulator
MHSRRRSIGSLRGTEASAHAVDEAQSNAGAPLQKAIRVVIVEDLGLFRAGLRQLIESRPALKVVGEAPVDIGARTVVAREQPDVVIVDPDPTQDGQRDGLSAVALLAAAARKASILVLTGVDDPEFQRSAIRSGAIGVVSKNLGGDTFLNAIEKVHAGEAWLSRSMVANLLVERAHDVPAPPDSESARIASLSKREREVVDCVSEGLSNEEVAHRLFLSQATVRHHLTSIFSKLDISSRSNLIVYAFRRGLSVPAR